MPSQLSSWFARHCTPPPPLNTSSACPCANCYNLGTDVAPRQHRQRQPQQQQQRPFVRALDDASRRPSSTTPADSDSFSICSVAEKPGTTITTTTHIERVTPQ
ncbi:Protein-ribulosamine 3-kinase [Purpureocillium takamizusanense]|uniref:Protein-ribulosamine 3-kinase n=1 Tax=Purpureocillium takamizusanense TaxID=2060973 RepID=A0A9Q8QHN1_9HYPO|nr:Protein-ribulosamine 3-kinase [Purpureocillium takamizusanense]UNI19785.1 Protein-ribulosamine 3-kinase [Purpureocillium takamizusanense]